MMLLLRLLLCCGLCASAAAQELQWRRVSGPETAPLAIQSTPDTPDNYAPIAATSTLATSAGRRPSLPPRALYYDALITDVARQYAIDPLLVHAVINTESAYQPAAMSGKGALGLMQVMPATGARFGKTTLTQPRDNVEAGVAYLSWLIRRFGGRLDLVMAGYNAGEGAVARYGNAVPPYAETQAYVRKVLAYYASLNGRIPAATRPREPAATPTVAHRPARNVGDLEKLLHLFIGSPPHAAPPNFQSKKVRY